MSPEWLTAIGTLGTFLVIAASAIAAILQLRHLRMSNQIEAIQYAVVTFSGKEMQRAIAFVRYELREKLNDPSFRKEIRERFFDPESHPEYLICNFQEQMGTYVRNGLIPFEIYMDVAHVTPDVLWEDVKTYVAVRRSMSQRLSTYENFEWLAGKSAAHRRRYPNGLLEGKFERLPTPNPWSAEDKESER